MRSGSIACGRPTPLPGGPCAVLGPECGWRLQRRADKHPDRSRCCLRATGVLTILPKLPSASRRSTRVSRQPSRVWHGRSSRIGAGGFGVNPTPNGPSRRRSSRLQHDGDDAVSGFEATLLDALLPKWCPSRRKATRRCGSPESRTWQHNWAWAAGFQRRRWSPGQGDGGRTTRPCRKDCVPIRAHREREHVSVGCRCIATPTARSHRERGANLMFFGFTEFAKYYLREVRPGRSASWGGVQTGTRPAARYERQPERHRYACDHSPVPCPAGRGVDQGILLLHQGVARP